MVATTEPLAVTHVTLIDGTGAAPIADATVLLRDGRVAAAGPAAAVPVPEGCREIEGRGRWLIPGLADAHVHVQLSSGEPALRHWLAWGVTTVRDLGGDPDVVLPLRDRERAGALVGARVLAYGPFLDGDPPIFGNRRQPGLGDLGNSVRVLTTPESVDETVDACLAMGVDGFKLYAGLRSDLLARVVQRVGSRVPVNAHLGRTWASEAAEAGVNCLEHVHASIYQDVARPEDRHTRDGGNGAMPNYWTWLSEGWSRADLDAPYVQRFIELLVEKGVYLSATTDLLGPGGLAGSPHQGEDPDRVYAPRAQVERWQEQAQMMEQARQSGAAPPPPAPPDPALGQAALEKQLAFLGMFLRAGGKLLAGTDTGVIRLIPGVALHNELAFLTRAGVDPLTVIHIATQRAAEAMRRAEEQGSLTPGKRGDAVLLTADPLTEISNTRSIELVIKDGVVYRPDELWVR
ncbi:MAG: amidohydrolase family protein [Dehalococcoidia bacterium]